MLFYPSHEHTVEYFVNFELFYFVCLIILLCMFFPHSLLVVYVTSRLDVGVGGPAGEDATLVSGRCCL